MIPAQQCPIPYNDAATVMSYEAMTLNLKFKAKPAADKILLTLH
jgi:hypothetical protein